MRSCTLTVVTTTSLRQIEYKDFDGRLSRRLIPVGAPDYDASVGIVVGPPPLGVLDLPLSLEVALNNELYARGLFTERDITKRRNEAIAAVMAACRVDVERILASLHAMEEG